MQTPALSAISGGQGVFALSLARTGRATGPRPSTSPAPIRSPAASRRLVGTLRLLDGWKGQQNAELRAEPRAFLNHLLLALALRHVPQCTRVAQPFRERRLVHSGLLCQRLGDRGFAWGYLVPLGFL